MLRAHFTQFNHVFAAINTSLWTACVGRNKDGKNNICEKVAIVSNVEVMLDSPPEDIKYFFSEYQDTFAEIKSLVPNIKFIEGVPNAIFHSINPKTRNLYIFDGRARLSDC